MSDLRSLIHLFWKRDKQSEMNCSQVRIERLKGSLNHLRTARTAGGLKPHKPLMLLTILDLFDAGVIKENRIPYDGQLIRTFTRYFYAIRPQDDRCRPEFPFFHLANDNFLRHKTKPGQKAAYKEMKRKGTWPRRIEQTVTYAYLEDYAFSVISDPVGRQTIRDFILETFFSAEEQEKLRQVMNGRSAAPAGQQPLSAVQTTFAGTGADDETPRALGSVADQPPRSPVGDRWQGLSSLASGEVQAGDTAAPEPFPEAEDITQPLEYGDPGIRVHTGLVLHQEAHPLDRVRKESHATPFNAASEVRSEGAASTTGPHVPNLGEHTFRPDAPIQELGLSVRACNALTRAGVVTVGKFMAMSESELWAIRNVGSKTMDEIRRVRERLGSIEGVVAESYQAISVETPQVNETEESQRTLPVERQEAASGHLLVQKLPESWGTVAASFASDPNIGRQFDEMGIADDRDLLRMTLPRCAASAIPSDDWAQIFVASKSRYRTDLAVGPSPSLARPTDDLHRLGLNMRAANALQRAGVTSLAQLARLTLADLIAIKNFGLDAFRDVLTALRSRPEVMAAASREEMEVCRAHDILTAALGDSVPGPLIDKLVQAGIRELADLEQWTFEDLSVQAKLTIEEAQRLYRALQSKGLFAPRSSPDNLLVQSCDFEYLKRLGVPLHQLGINRLGLPHDLEFRLVRLGLDTVEKLARMSKVVLSHWMGRDAKQALGLLSSRLSLYLDHVARLTNWEAEVAGTAPCPVHLIQLKETTLESLVDAWLEHIRDARSRQVLALRYGLSGGEQRTLSEIGETLGLTRERVRQLEQKAIKRLQAAPDDPLVSALLWAIEQEMERRGGLMSLDQIGEIVEASVEIGEVERDGALQLLLKLRASGLHEVDGNRWILPKYSEGLVLETVDKLADLLTQNHAPMTLEQIYARLCDTAWYARCSNHYSVTVEWVTACLATDDRFEEREDGSWGLARWRRSRTDEIVMALRTLGEPSHYTTITAVANELLPPDEQASSRYVHALLQRKSDLLIRTGPGVYGLTEWGHSRARYYKVIAQEFLEQKGEPQPLDAIWAAVCAERQVTRESLTMLLGTNPLFKTYPGGRFGLAAWAEAAKPPDDGQTDEFIESLKGRLLSSLLSTHEGTTH